MGDTGITADGEFIGDVLHHVGLLFFREVKDGQTKSGSLSR
jgi:hypothetical protein